MKTSVAWILVILVLLVGCESKNEHFCSKYQYFYRELTAPGILPIRDLRQQLEKDLTNKNRDPERARMALFVLNDIERDMKPKQEEPRDYCMRLQRWSNY